MPQVRFLEELKLMSSCLQSDVSDSAQITWYKWGPQLCESCCTDTSSSALPSVSMVMKKSLQKNQSEKGMALDFEVHGINRSRGGRTDRIPRKPLYLGQQT